MKPTEFKRIIKESVREAIQEELKDILLEALKSSPSKSERITESTPIQNRPITETQNQLSPEQQRNLYSQMLRETPITTNNVQTFNPMGAVDPVNGSLPSGEVSMNQIMGLLNK